MSFKCFRFIFNVNFVLYTNERPFEFSKTTTMKMAGNFRTSYVTSRGEIRKIRVSSHGCSDVYEFYECFSFQ